MFVRVAECSLLCYWHWWSWLGLDPGKCAFCLSQKHCWSKHQPGDSLATSSLLRFKFIHRKWWGCKMGCSFKDRNIVNSEQKFCPLHQHYINGNENSDVRLKKWIVPRSEKKSYLKLCHGMIGINLICANVFKNVDLNRIKILALQKSTTY